MLRVRNIKRSSGSEVQIYLRGYQADRRHEPQPGRNAKAKQFREDLWFRLNVFPIHIPRFGIEGRTSPLWSIIWYSANPELRLPAPAARARCD